MTEPQLTISDFVTVEKNIKKLSNQNQKLEIKMNNLISYLQSSHIQIPDFYSNKTELLSKPSKNSS